MPDLETTRRLAHVLRVPVREMLIRSGRLSEEDLPLSELQDSSSDTGSSAHRLTLEEAAAGLGVPADQWDKFIKVAGQFLPTGTDVRPERATSARGGSVGGASAVKDARKG
ncbi:hypothetical protein [Streptomyces hypolithicus]